MDSEALARLLRTVAEFNEWKAGVEGEIDLVEEVARHHGYANIERVIPGTARVSGLDAAPLAAEHVDFPRCVEAGLP